MIYFDRVSKRYPGGQEALAAISLRLEKGEMAFLTGHSGAGKSTLLKLLLLMEKCSGGTLQVDGYDLNKLSGKQINLHRQKMGVVFQNHLLLNDRTIFDNVALPLKVAGFQHQEASRRVRAALDKVGLLSKEKTLPLSLSTGEQQRVGIARAIVNRPKIILADEPTGNLDPALSIEIMGLFEQFNQVGVTVLLASHDLSLISSLRHRIIALENGKLVNSN